MSSLRPELHVAQQIRRDKLRIQNLQQQQQHFPNLEEQQLSLHQNMDLLQLHHHHHDQQQSLYSSSPHYYYPSSSSSSQQQCLVNNNNFMVNYATLNSVANNHNNLVTVANPPPHNYHNNSEMASLMHHHNYVDNYTPTTVSASGWSNHNNNQGLSLSLSSSSSPILSHHHQNVNVKSSTTNQNAANATSSSSSSSSYYYRNSVGPLGPFTGYATILKSSRFLKPCQKLLDEYCRRHCCSAPPSSSISEWPSTATTTTNDDDDDQSDVLVVSGKGGGGSSSNKVVAGGCSSSSSIFHGPSTSSRPECQKNKAKLLFMQDEVTRRYKQYHQQMQMVVSSFESVAGLNSATPYASLALKLVSKNFKSLNNSISDQLKLLCQAMGEDSTIPLAANASNQFESNAARLRCMDQTLHRNKPGGGGGGGNMDFEPQQHVWRPQRGLPERAVAILKAWLFEHFLHPYPTDTDKHMLATQTGLSRNQVSNWFINARVRVWKPMVEEIHMLETKGANQISSNRMGEGTSATINDGSNHAKVLVDQPLNKFAGAHTAAANPISGRQFECLQIGSSSSLLANANAENDDLQQHEEVQWSQEKRSKLESMDGTLIGLMPYRRTGSVGGEFGGLGPVSLTLELRHGVEGSQQQIQGHEEQLRHHFGGMIS